MIRIRAICIWCFLLLNTIVSGQLSNYHYKAELGGIDSQWHRLELPNYIFKDLDRSLHAIRIYGITEENDTLEAPFVQGRKTHSVAKTDVAFNRINESRSNGAYYYTFEIPSEETINEIQLQLGNSNFDWRLDLEGSQDQQQWFTLTSDYRILSIQNELTNYQFTRIRFPDAKYRYFRMRVRANSRPRLNDATFEFQKTNPANFRSYRVRSFQSHVDQHTRNTMVELLLEEKVPVARFALAIRDSIDYYRPVTISYLADSLQTEQGWIESYRSVYSGTLSSLDDQDFAFTTTIAEKWKIEITNDDNAPLDITGVEAKGPVHELLIRFAEPARYYLLYGNDTPSQPKYDIGRFANEAKQMGAPLTLGTVEKIPRTNEQTKSPLFKNKAWLWGIMILIIAVLGWFSIKMIRQ
ncbi:MAG: DUF3999 family protein [Bacteroidota bacterium]